MPNAGLLFAAALIVFTSAQPADLPSLAIPAMARESFPLFDPTKFEIRGGFLVAPFGAQQRTSDITGALVFPKFVRLQGWQDVVIPRFRIGGADNLFGRTSYAYADALWTVNFNRVFAEVFLGGLSH